MLRLSDLIAGYLSPYPAGLVLDEPTVVKALLAAVRFYSGYAELSNAPPWPQPDGDGVHSPVRADNDLFGESDVELTPSEWAIIRPLFLLYVERENTVHVEASRGLGADVFTRSTAEVLAAIESAEAALSLSAWFMPVESV